MWTKGISNRTDDGVGSTGHVWDEDLVELNAPLPRWWLYLFNITIVFALVYLAIFPGLGNIPGMLGWTQVGRYDAEITKAQAAQEAVFSRFRDMTSDELISDPEAITIGRRLFANNCAMCHGSDARGAPGFPNLTDHDWLYGGSYDQILTSVSEGRTGMMPPMGAALGEDGVRDVAVYVQQLSGQKTDPDLAAAGKVHFETVCAACHGADGKGNQLLGAPNLTDNIWLYGGDPETIEETVSQGRNGKMPSHDTLLSEDRQRLVAAYVASLSSQSGQ
jgi:cytochrome c oxidase cbb3-type subunit 3